MIPSGEPLYPFYSQGKFGFFDRNFQIAIPAIYEHGSQDSTDNFGEFSEDFAIVFRTDRRYVFVGTDGRGLTNDAWFHIRHFAEGLGRVKVNGSQGKWGFIDTKGKMVIEPQFDWVDPFSDGVARVTSDERKFQGWINRQGNWLARKGKIQDGLSFSEGLAGFEIGNKWGFINTDGEVAIKPVFDFVGHFREGLACIGVGEYEARNFGFIDRAGNMVIPPKFPSFGSFNEGYANIDLAEEKFYIVRGRIDKRGELAFTMPFSGLNLISEGLSGAAPMPTDTTRQISPNWGVIDTAGNFIIEPQFNYVYRFRHGIAQVRLHNMNSQKDTLLHRQYGQDRVAILVLNLPIRSPGLQQKPGLTVGRHLGSATWGQVYIHSTISPSMKKQSIAPHNSSCRRKVYANMVGDLLVRICACRMGGFDRRVSVGRLTRNF